jgi:hypothetical protein
LLKKVAAKPPSSKAQATDVLALSVGVSVFFVLRRLGALRDTLAEVFNRGLAVVVLKIPL